MKRNVAFVLLAVFLLAACAPPAAPVPTAVPTTAPSLTPPPAAPAPTASNPSPTFVKLIPGQADYKAFQPLEWSLETDGAFANPYDPAVVDLQVRFTSPTGETLLTPAFWTQEYNPASGQPAGSPGWKVRFTPTLPGQWSAQAVLASPPLQSEPQSFTVAADPAAPGFVRVNPRNPRYFAFDNGQTFFPIGLNIGWAGEQTLEDYTRWMDRLSAQGGTVMRVWMASWSFGLEWNDTPLGDYTHRLQRAWLLDQVFRLAEQRGIKIVLVLINHGMFSIGANPQWNENPLNVANGGPLKAPEEFTTNPKARRLFAQRLRYTAARWAYSPALMAWEWWNEEDLTPITPDLLIPWIQEMTPQLRAWDPYRHLVTTSFASANNPEVFNLPEIDFAQIHRYDSTDPAQTFPGLFRQLAGQIPDKPILFGEFGDSASIEDAASPDQAGLHLHTGLWASTFAGFASGSMYWWWDSYVDPLNLWPVFGRLDRFLRGVDLAEYRSGSVGLSPSSAKVVYRILKASDRQLIWLHDPLYSVKEMVHITSQMAMEKKTPEPGWVYLPEPLTGLSIALSDLPDGKYTAYWYSPRQGEWLQEQPVSVSGGKGSLPIPAFQGDLAAQLLPAGAPPPK